jgi:sodium/proline symporter
MTFAIAFAVYTLFIIAIGIYSARYARRSDEDYFLAGRSLGPWVAALSASASSESGWVTLGLVGWAFVSGVSAYWIIPGCLLGFIFNWFVLAGRMRDHSHRLNALTLPDFFAFTFGERLPLLRILTVIVILIAMWLYVAAQFAAAGDAFTAAFSSSEREFSYAWGVVIGAAIVLLYVVLGGFRAACWTDFIQALIMVGTLVVFPLFALIDLGGYGQLLAVLETESESMTQFIPVDTTNAGPGMASALLIGFLIGHGALGINFGYPGQPHVLVRFMALRRRKEAIIGGFVAVTWGAMVYWGACTIGLIVRALTIEGAEWTAPLAEQIATNAGDAGETGLVLAARYLIPTGILSGMVLAAVLAAICSTADSQLVVAASSGANDLYGRIVDKSRRTEHMVVNRIVVLALGVGAVLIALDETIQVYSFVLTFGWAILGAAFGPQVILVLLWRRASYAGCIAGMLTGFIMAIVWKMTYMDYRAAHPEAGLPEIYNLPLAFIFALIVNVIVSLLTPSRPEDVTARP